MQTMSNDQFAPNYKTGVGAKVREEIDNQDLMDNISGMLSKIMRGRPSGVSGAAPMPTKSYGDVMTMNEYN